MQCSTQLRYTYEFISSIGNSAKRLQTSHHTVYYIPDAIVRDITVSV